MTPTPLNEYLAQFARELRARGAYDGRLVDEAREHLADAIEDGLRRGLSAEDAERAAVEQFGPPELIAAHAVSGRDRMWHRIAAVGETLWRWKWWLIAPTLVMAVATSVFASYFLRSLYRSETVIQIRPAGLPDGVAGSSSAAEHLRDLTRATLTRDQLETLIRDVGLYRDERAREPLSDLVRRMRRDIGVVVDADADDEFRISFQSPDPRLAMQTTARLASLLVEQNLQAAERIYSTTQFLDSQVEDLRQRLIAEESTLAAGRAANGGRPRQADLVQYQVLQDRYKDALQKREQARSAASLERTSLGFQFKVTEPARLPEHPEGPSKLGVNTAGALAGLGLGLLFVVMRGRSTAGRIEAAHR